MRLTLLSILLQCLLSSGVSQAQPYHRLLKPDRSWDIAWFDGSTICGTVSAFRAVIDGDTIINGQSYSKFYSHEIRTANGQPPFCSPFVALPTRTLLPTFLREDTLLKRVYILKPGQPEGLLYDFTLAVGDTLHSATGGINFGSPGPQDFIISQIDTLTLANGIQSRRFWFQNALGSVIEGVGSDVNLFGPFMQGIGVGETLMCASENGQPVYHGQFGNCMMPFMATSEPVHTVIELSPNPVADFFTLKGLPTSADIMITDATGRVVLKEKASSTGQVLLAGLTPGIYQLSATWKGGRWGSRLVKE